MTYEMESQGVIVRVAPRFEETETDPQEPRFFWSYDVEIENRRTQSIQVLYRHWRIVDGRGARKEVRGAGVVGEQPVIASGAAHAYRSGVPLETAHGLMGGAYECIDLSDGAAFSVTIPTFALDSPYGPKHAN
jgi:ApaG protein